MVENISSYAQTRELSLRIVPPLQDPIKLLVKTYLFLKPSSPSPPPPNEPLPSSHDDPQ
jgi:hypothetical protein